MKQIRLFTISVAIAVSGFAGSVKVDFDSKDAVQAYAVKRIEKAFSLNPSWPDLQISLRVDPAASPEGYRYTAVSRADGMAVQISGGDAHGLLYGSMNLLEQLGHDPSAVKAAQETARFPFRALKFNLPWVSYRAGESLSLHKETCRDLAFWEEFLDMMVDNRFNALTLWSLHPFHLMIRNEQFPEACDLTDAELADWQNFWHALFAMAKERGIETYLVNWNIFVSPAFAKHHGVAEYCEDNISANFTGSGDKSELIKEYTRTTVTQLINTYPNLTGLGISLGERMGGFTPEEREEWILDTFVKGIEAADHPVRFIHRLPFSAGKGSGGSTDISTEVMTRNAIESIKLPTKILTEAKFNWSHAHSSPKLIKVHGGKLGDTYWNPPPKNYEINWMVRNEDFFALRWAEPDFVRTHIQMNGQDYVGGYYLGSECYIPAKDYISAPGFSPGYSFERQWLYYMVWGRLLYNPNAGDDIFINACTARYGDAGNPLFEALKAGSRMPLRLASFYNATWDFTLYSEGFMANKAKSNPERLITVEELIKCNPLEPDYISVREYVKMVKSGTPVPEGKVSPLQLAEQSAKDGESALSILKTVSLKTAPKQLEAEVASAKAWAHMNLYFAEKLRAAVALQQFRDNGDAEQGKLAVQCLEKAVDQWEQLAAVTDPVFAEMPLTQIDSFRKEGPDPRVFHWKLLLPAARAELQRVRDEVSGER
jgi:hypothetical protein